MSTLPIAEAEAQELLSRGWTAPVAGVPPRHAGMWVREGPPEIDDVGHADRRWVRLQRVADNMWRTQRVGSGMERSQWSPPFDSPSVAAAWAEIEGWI